MKAISWVVKRNAKNEKTRIYSTRIAYLVRENSFVASLKPLSSTITHHWGATKQGQANPIQFKIPSSY
jgi:hypothetical protein